MLSSYINQVADRYSKRNLVTNIYGYARAILAIGTLITFLFNKSAVLFSTLPDHYEILSESPFAKIGLFYLLSGHLIVARGISILILLAVVSGWRPRYTGILHWYIAYSFYLGCDFFDGGDQIAAIISLLLIPFCLCDQRKWVWSNNKVNQFTETEKTKNIFLNVLYFIIRLQVCIIYFQAGVAKMDVPEWLNGTAIYYWFTNHSFGAADWFKPLIVYLTSKPIFVVSVSWGTMVFEIILAMAIMMKRNSFNWKILLILGILFHLGIVVIHGLISFFCSMTACLILYLYPLNFYFNTTSFAKFLPQKFLEHEKT